MSKFQFLRSSARKAPVTSLLIFPVVSRIKCLEHPSLTPKKKDTTDDPGVAFV